MLGANKNFVKFCPILLFFIFLLFTPLITHTAQFTADNAQGFVDEANKGVGAESKKDVKQIAAQIAKGVFSTAGIIFFLLMFYGGYTWLMARGEEEEIKKAQNIIIGAIIGLFIMVGSYAITNFVLSRMKEPVSSAYKDSSSATPEGGSFCCLYEVQASNSTDILLPEFLESQGPNWLSEMVEDKEECATLGLTCDKEMENLCGTGNSIFDTGTQDPSVCLAKAKAKNE